jgi:hypothetical protein
MNTLEIYFQAELRKHKSNSQLFYQDLDSLACMVDELAN